MYSHIPLLWKNILVRKGLWIAALSAFCAGTLVLAGCPQPTPDPRQLDSDGSLKSLTIDKGTLRPVFNPAVKDYSAIVPNAVDTITVTGVPNSEKASVSANSGTPQPLNVGLNIITITVTAEDGTANAYTITVERLDASTIPIHSKGDFEKIGVEDSHPLAGAYVLMDNLVLENWKPIGGSADPFSGAFDGKGYAVTLKSFHHEALSNTSGKDLGVFGRTKGISTETAAEIRNLSIFSEINQTITTTGACYVGLLAGYADEYTKFASVSVSGSLTINRNLSNGPAIYGGGIVGYVKNSRISDSTSAASLDFSSTVESSGSPAGNAGGIAGYGANGTVITNCSTSGSIQIASRGFQSGAGGIIGYVTGATSEVSRCSASGDITMTGLNQQEFAGGIAGYSGGSAKISQCHYTGGTVQDIGLANQYPYAGGISGYNYNGAIIEECFSSGTVRAEGALIPYAGGVAGYTSGNLATIKDSYSTMTAIAVSQGKITLVGGVVAATANTGKTLRCYATGSVSATVNGQGNTGMGVGIAVALNVGGISGSIYYGDSSNVENCVALNPSVTGTDSSSGAVFKVCRIAGDGTSGTIIRTNNHAYSGMTVTPGGGTYTPDKGTDKVDGADCGEKPGVEFYRDTLGWDFTTVWKMGADGYPILRWQN
jgi:hypothetical protein